MCARCIWRRDRDCHLSTTYVFQKMLFKNLPPPVLPLIASGSAKKGEKTRGWSGEHERRKRWCLCTLHSGVLFGSRTMVMHINSAAERGTRFFVFQDCFYSTLRNEVVDKKFSKKIFPHNCAKEISSGDYHLRCNSVVQTELVELFFCANIWLKLIKTRKQKSKTNESSGFEIF